jgi:Protein of unknown function (DUF1592)/Protein of unknown function (DUF1588)/Protein of unknown function (DUF1587)/Protein of unknown function (DUF1595)/Protein of unknown function (DUF1585)/Ca-dependent carbohydrate-binding module xylan-binding/Planctomycete cytochrome C
MRIRHLACMFFCGVITATGAFFHHEEATAEAGSKEPAIKNSDAVEKIIAPFLAKNCVECHGPKKKNAGLALHIYTDEKSILKDRKKWHEVVRMLTNGEMPPAEKQVRPDLKEVDAVLKAVHDIFHTADANGKRDPGRVTMRRLNRTEYNNTIRDLVGVDFKPADDFPADDVGYGFDNIGDVLTISPVLMERYLAAAETIMNQAVLVGDPPPPSKRPTAGQFLQSKESKVIRDTSLRNLDVAGEFSITHKITDAGSYTFRVRAWSTPVGDEPVKVAFKVGGKQIHTAEIKAGDKKNAKNYEAPPIELKPGDHTISLVFLNPYTDPKAAKPDEAKRTLHVQHFQFEGPADTFPKTHKRLMAADKAKPKREQAREILTRFASKAYRRPATKEEVERLLKFVDQAEKNKEKFEAGINLAMQAVLCSPKFLFRVELDDRPDSNDPHPIDDYQLASRLSYFLWATMPDDELFALAAKKELHANIKPQVVRMLKDAKAYSLVENFAVQWLQLRLLKTHSPDAKFFPDFDDELRNAMARETELYFDAVIKEDRSILDLIDSNFTYMNQRLARHYGIADTNGNRTGQKPTAKPGTTFERRFKFGGKRNDEFLRVTFGPEETERGGLLTQASILTITSNPTRTSPVKRGKWVLEQILGTPPPPPPPDVPELEEKGQLKGTLRERMEQHRKNPSCANCHARLDPPGFAFENYDAIGKFRLKDGDAPVDPSGILPNGQKFQGPKELKQILLGKKELFSRALTEKMLTYGLGRGVEYYDKSAVDAIVSALAKDDFRFSTLIVETATSDPFRMRRGKGQVE